MPLERYVGHIHHLRERLWTPGAHGRASVLVGAGFSRNAQAIYPDAPQFALLSDYVDVFAAALGRNVNDAKFIPIDRLGEEYESSFGREALNEVIQRLIPWNSYKPGELHRQLLKLPWADVFTTNYDPLLENARFMVPSRRYDLVTHPDDLPTSQGPRIVKLHGSFPSARPFIFTEEDFRQYPLNFAPFINLVQQSMLENTLCLIGFQGDDPNFLRWAGWVRDELGSHRPLIYLVNILSLNDARRRYLEKRGIIPIDLGDILEFKDDTPMSERYKIANHWFLQSLQNGRPEDLLDWPARSGTDWKAPYSPQPVVARRARVMPPLDPESYSAHELYLYWRERRETYPNWEVFRTERSNHLNLEPGDGYIRAFDLISELASPLDLLLARELAWRMDLQCIPLHGVSLEIILKVLNRYEPFIGKYLENDRKLSPLSHPRLILPAEWTQNNSETIIDWRELGSVWIEIAFLALTSYRMFMKINEFEEWANVISQRIDLNHYPEWQARWYWEKVRLSISILDINEARKHLNSWPREIGNPFWEIRRAAAESEIGIISEAERTFTRAYERIQGGRLPGQPNARIMSQQAWALRLRPLIFRGTDPSFDKDENSDREGLWKVGIDPSSDIRNLKSDVLKSYSEATNVFTRLDFKRGFDAGQAIRTISFEMPGFEINFSPAIKFLQFLDWSGQPIRAIGKDDFQPTLLLLGDVLTFPIAVLTCIRSGDMNTLNGIMSRERIAALEEAQINFLAETLFKSLNSIVKSTKENNVDLRLDVFYLRKNILLLGAEALSRLLLRLSKDFSSKILDLTLSIAQLKAVQSNGNFYSTLSSLVNRILEYWNRDEAEILIARFADFPFPIGENLISSWPEPLSHQIFNDIRRSNSNRWVSVEIVDKLIGFVSTGNKPRRMFACIRLYRLFKMNALNASESRRFGDAIWNQTSSHSGLPVNVGIRISLILEIPVSKSTLPIRRFKEYYLNGGFFSRELDFSLLAGTGFSGDAFAQGFADLLISSSSVLDPNPVTWTTDEIRVIFVNLQEWWADWKAYVTKMIRDPYGAHNASLQEASDSALRVIREMVIPQWDYDKAIVENLEHQIVNQMRAWNFVATPHSLDDRRISSEEIIIRIISNNDIRDNLRHAVRMLSVRKSDNMEILRKVLVFRLINRTSPDLESVILAIAHLIEKGQNIIRSDEIKFVLESLNCIAEETALKPQWITAVSQEGRTDRSDVRAAASTLASVLSSSDILSLVDSNLKTNPIIEKWRDIGKADPLPEVRAPWKGVVSTTIQDTEQP